jgi:exodeoxyribonuclease V alpha subunit
LDDGAEDVITTTDLEELTHGKAISVRKAQGSAFKRIIIPVVRPDRILLYSATTRGIETVFLVGDIDLINEIILEAPASFQRTTALRFDEN